MGSESVLLPQLLLPLSWRCSNLIQLYYYTCFKRRFELLTQQQTAEPHWRSVHGQKHSARLGVLHSIQMKYLSEGEVSFFVLPTSSFYLFHSQRGRLWKQYEAPRGRSDASRRLQPVYPPEGWGDLRHPSWEGLTQRDDGSNIDSLFSAMPITSGSGTSSRRYHM